MKQITGLLISAMLWSIGIMAQPVNQPFTASGTYTVPTGYTAIITVEAWGGGGGGGTSMGGRDGGGGGGAYASSTFSVLEGTYTVMVGMGGAAGMPGTASSFGSTVVAAGGESTSSGTGGMGGAAMSSMGTITRSGGNGGSGGIGSPPNGGGGGGGSATASANGNNGNDNNGNTGGAGGMGEGNGGAGGGNTANGSVGMAPGGGGGGKGNNGMNSGAGARGEVRITVVCYIQTVAIPTAGNITCPDPMPLTISPTLTGASAPNMYQWQRSDDSGTNWTDITTADLDSDPVFAPVTYAGFQESALTITTQNSTINNFQYRLSACSVTSDALTLKVVECALPIELLSFSGKQVGAAIQLHWETATERDNDYVEVQRSHDGKRFEALGRVPGAGNSATPLRYTFADVQPLPGVNYYRLRQVDFDGQQAFHPIIAVRFDDKNAPATGITVFPTFVSEDLNIRFAQAMENAGTLLVSDLNGRILLQRTLGAGTEQTQVHVSSLPAGHYIVVVQTERTREVSRFVKE
ncbi:MAG TPA: T9SS type A sorting domain-containing protein [Saprospiraceae bacterium]|nr:T9SS type A sorting domain-containing protein [Saprospiraceae bacterium]